jgi:broad specificity phosphatase PhoE
MRSNTLKLLASAMLVSFFAACGDSDSSSGNAENEIVADSVAIRDSINWIDSVRITDSLNIIDSVRYKTVKKYLDSLRIKDSIRITDSLNIVDSVVTRILDSIRYIDSVRYIDSTRYMDVTVYHDSAVAVDSIVTHEPEEYLGKCSAENAGERKNAAINGESRSYYCDSQTLLWRIATKAEVMSVANDAYVAQSHVVNFAPLDSVVHILAPDEKLIVILRHAEREDEITLATPLTDLGKQQSFDVGQDLKGRTDVYFAGSQYIRTHQTYNYIGKGMDLGSDTLGDTIPELNEGWFTKDMGSYYMTLMRENDDGRGVITKWAAEGGYTDVFYDLAPRSSELLEDHLIPALDKSGKSIGIFISHDVMITPLLAYISERRIKMKYYLAVKGLWNEDNWLNYLAGIAVILKPDGSKVFYAVRGLESGTMKLPIDQGVDPGDSTAVSPAIAVPVEPDSIISIEIVEPAPGGN